MKRITITLTITLALIFGMTTMSHAWGLPKKSFSRAIDKALTKERWDKPEEAQEYWKEAVEKGEELMEALPDKCEYFMGTARCYYALGDYDKAITLYNQALKIKADEGVKDLPKSYPWIYVYLGLSYAKTDDTVKAVEAWEQVPFTIGSTYGAIQNQIAKYKPIQKEEK